MEGMLLHYDIKGLGDERSLGAVHHCLLKSVQQKEPCMHKYGSEVSCYGSFLNGM